MSEATESYSLWKPTYDDMQTTSRSAKTDNKYWSPTTIRKTNVLLMASHREAMEENLTWISTVKDALEINGMRCLF